jgi:carboxymethylenebutenolidase
VLTGGVGLEEVRKFYSERFIPQQPPDTEIVPLSRTVGNDRVVDELISRFTHTIKMEWLLPGIPPTGRRVEIPLVVVVQFRDGKIASEHIYWDQASVLVQVGLIDPETLPVAGSESAQKVLDPTSVPSNGLMERTQRGK